MYRMTELSSSADEGWYCAERLTRGLLSAKLCAATLVHLSEVLWLFSAPSLTRSRPPTGRLMLLRSVKESSISVQADQGLHAEYGKVTSESDDTSLSVYVRVHGTGGTLRQELLLPLDYLDLGP